MKFFPVDVGIFNDRKFRRVRQQYGPLGEVIYLRLLCFIYENGYYLQFDSLDELAADLVDSVGNRWLRGRDTAKNVIHLLAECELFDQALLQANVLTSAGVQTRYLKAFPRKQIDKKYWLLDAPGGPTAAAPGVAERRENALDLPENAAVFGENAAELAQKPAIEKREPKKTKQNKIPTPPPGTAQPFAAWTAVLALLQQELKPASFRNWFGADTVLAVTGEAGLLRVLVADEYAQAYMEESLTAPLSRAAQAATGQEWQVEFVSQG